MEQRPIMDGKTVCKEGDFEVRVSETGRACALWKAWGRMFESLDELKAAGILNSHEKILLDYGIVR